MVPPMSEKTMMTQVKEFLPPPTAGQACVVFYIIRY